MSKEQWGHGYHTGKQDQSDVDFAIVSSERAADKISLDYFLMQIEEQIKLLQQAHGNFSSVGYWCATTLDIVNKAHREFGTKYEFEHNKRNGG